jgi:hypothetical protein
VWLTVKCPKKGSVPLGSAGAKKLIEEAPTHMYRTLNFWREKDANQCRNRRGAGRV